MLLLGAWSDTGGMVWYWGHGLVLGAWSDTGRGLVLWAWSDIGAWSDTGSVVWYWEGAGAISGGMVCCGRGLILGALSGLTF